jgi:hypothetical protein
VGREFVITFFGRAENEISSSEGKNEVWSWLLVKEDYNGCLGRDTGMWDAIVEVGSGLLSVAPEFEG